MDDDTTPVNLPVPEPSAGPDSAANPVPEPAAAPPPASPPAGSLLLGRIAVERGFINRDQLQECILDQGKDTAAGRPPRSLGILLVEKGFLTDTKLISLLEEQKARFQQPNAAVPVRQEDVLFGKLIAQGGLASPQQINECLRMQAESEERGEPALRLGELLIQKGYVTKESITRLLAMQQKTILACARCNTRYNVANYQEGKEYRCKRCNGPIAPPKTLDSVHVDESVHDAPPVLGEDVPAEVVAAARNPSSRFGKYIIIKELGRGGMGVVYKAWQPDLCRTVALKMLSSRGSATGSQPAVTEEEVQRFYREAQTAARLRHVNIVSIFEVGQHQGQYYLALEFVDGMTLDRWIKAGKLKHEHDTEGGKRTTKAGAPFRRAAEIVRDVSLAVHSAHEQEVIHRDIKPQNVLMDRQGRPHVTDFGLAKTFQAERKDAATITVSGVILGTPAYMSPEQASGGKRRLDARTDIYSLGAILYECLVGHPPFHKGSSIDIVMQVLKSEPVPPSEAARTPVPKDLEIICQRAMEKEPARRYQTAKALAQDLDRWLQGEPILARPQSTIYRLQKKIRNNPVVVSAVAAAVVALFAVLVISLGGPSQKQLDLKRFEVSLAEGKARLEQKRYADALFHFQQAQKIDPQNREVIEGTEQCNAALERERRIKRMQEEEERRRLAEAERQKKEMEEKLAKVNADLAALIERGKQAKTEEEKRAIEAEALKKEEERRRIAAGGAGAATTKPPDVAVKPPDVAVKPPDVAVKPPDVPAPAGGVAPPVPLKGEGPKLLAAHRYGELYDAIRRDRNAYGPITDYQVACLRSGQELWEALYMGKQALKDRKPRVAFPVLKALPDVVESAIADFNVAKGNIDLQVRMRDGSTGTISQPISGLDVGALVELARQISKDEDHVVHLRFGNLYAVQGDEDGALAELLRAKQLGAAADEAIANVVESACVLAADPVKHRADLEALLEKHGKSLPDPARTRLESAVAGLRKQVASGEADALLKQAEALAQKRQVREAMALAGKVIKDYPDSKAADAAKAFLLTLPHPDGRLVNGFDAPADLRGAAKSPNAEIAAVADPAHVREGAGAVRIRLAARPAPAGGAAPPRDGAIAGFKLDPALLARAKAINFWVRGTGDQPGQVLFCCYSAFPRDYYFAEFRIGPAWRQVRLPVTAFAAEGTPGWGAINLVSFSYFGAGTVEFVVDSLRVEE